MRRTWLWGDWGHDSPAKRNARANALGLEMSLEEQKEGLCGWSSMSSVRGEQTGCRIFQDLPCRSLYFILNAAGSCLPWETVQKGKGCDCGVENRL